MKLATLRDGSRDGRLVVVSHDLTRCSDARHIAPTLQAALDDWEAAAPQLELIARGIEWGAQPVERFHERDARSPLPFAGDTAAFGDPRGALDAGASAVAAGLAAIVGAVPAGADPATAGAAVRLVMLASAASPDAGPEATSFSPVAVTPEEVGPGLVVIELNGGPFSRTDQRADAASFVAGAARARPLAAGIVGPAPTADPPVSVPIRAGDTVRLEMRDASGHSIFGAIEQTVA